MTVFPQVTDLCYILAEAEPETFLVKLRETDVARELENPLERDIELIILFYFSMMENIKDLTYFSSRTGDLMRVIIGKFKDRSAFIRAVLHKVGSAGALDSRTLSTMIMFSCVASSYEPLFRFVERYLVEKMPDGRINSSLMVGARAILTATSLLFSLTSSRLIPPEIRKFLRDDNPLGRARELAKLIEGTILMRSKRWIFPTNEDLPEPENLIVLFALEDFIFDKLNTLTKLYCDFFHILTKYTNIILKVRVFRVTYKYKNAPMPATWDPEIGNFCEMMRTYFGEKADNLMNRIDFQFVNCWEPNDDYVTAVRTTLTECEPHVCVTCLDRPNSFLELVLYTSGPLMQFEIINGSEFIRFCDVLMPNGVVDERRRELFHFVEAPLPAIPFPMVEVVTKEELGCTEANYVMAVVGKEFPRRLEGEGKHEVSMAFARALVELLDVEPALSILLIGEAESEIAKWFVAADVAPDRNRLRVIEFATDLRSTELACDLIVNPPIMGGGRGIALAISDKRPVLIFHGADAANFVPPGNVCADMAEFVLNTRRYVGLGCGYRETYVAASGVVPFSEEYNRQAAVSFVEAARTAFVRGQNRFAERSGHTRGRSGTS